LSFLPLRDLRLLDDPAVGANGGLLDGSSEGPVDGLLRSATAPEDRPNEAYPAFDMAVADLPFLLARGLGMREAGAAESAASTLVRFVRRRGGAWSAVSCSDSSGEGSRAAAFRFLVEDGAGVGAGGVEICGLSSVLDDPVESLAEERVTLGGMGG
jgi:hypothetical protein